MKDQAKEEEDDWIYEYIVGIITSPSFRTPIKNFIDENCSGFTEVEENTFQQGALFQEFVKLIENLLHEAMKENLITDEMFLAASEKGLNNEKHKKYFEQLISFNNYNYFKNLMVKRNYQILKQAEEAMGNKSYQAKKKEHPGKFDDKEIQEAIKLSLVEEEKKRKLQALEDEDLKKAIWLSQRDQKKKSKATVSNVGSKPPEKKVEKPPVQPQPAPKKQPEPPKKQPEPQKKPEEKKNEFIPPELNQKTNVNLLVNLEETKGFQKVEEAKIVSNSKGFAKEPQDEKPAEDDKNKEKPKVETPKIEPSKEESQKVPSQQPAFVPPPNPALEASKKQKEFLESLKSQNPDEKKPEPVPPKAEKKPENVLKNDEVDNKFHDMKPEEKKKEEKATVEIKIESNLKKNQQVDDSDKILDPNKPREKVKIIVKNELDELLEEDKKPKEEKKEQVQENPFLPEKPKLQDSDASAKNNFFNPEKKQLGKIKEKKMGGLFFQPKPDQENPMANKANPLEQKPVGPVVQEEDEDLKQRFQEIEKARQLELEKFRQQLIEKKKADREMKEKEAALSQEDARRLELRKKLAERLKQNNPGKSN